MRLLLDTNIVMYLINDTNEMTADVEMMVTDFGNTLFICSATIRELVANWNKYEYMQKRWKSPAEMTLISSDRKFPFYRKQGLQLIYNKK